MSSRKEKKMLGLITRQLLLWLTPGPQLIKASELILVLMLTSMLAGACAGPGLPIPSKPSTNLAPLTPASAVPLAQLHWCPHTAPTKVQPPFPVLLPATLSADYCLSSVTVSSTVPNEGSFSLVYHHSYYNNNFTLLERLDPRIQTTPFSCRLDGFFEPSPSEPYPQDCSGTRSFNGQQLSISIHASEAREDIRIQFQALQPNVAFLPS
jgi:hypothetical protein